MSNHLIAYVQPPFYLSRHSCMVSCIRRPDDGLRPLVEYFVWRQHFPRSCSFWVYGMFMSLHAQYLQWKKYFSLYSFRNKTNWTYRDSYASFAQIFLIFCTVWLGKKLLLFSICPQNRKWLLKSRKKDWYRTDNSIYSATVPLLISHTIKQVIL